MIIFRLFYTVIVFCFLSGTAGAADPGGSAYVAEANEKKQAMLAAYLAKYARTAPVGCWFQSGYILAALELNRPDEIARSADMLRSIFKDPDHYANELVNHKPATEGPHLCYWGQPSLIRAYLHPNAAAILAQPIDLADPEAGTIREAMIAGFSRVIGLYSSRNDSADPNEIQASENHMFTRRASLLIMLEILLQEEQRLLASQKISGPIMIAGQTVGDHYETWRRFWRGYLAGSAFNGAQAEVASPTYTKYTAAALLLMADLSRSNIERSNAQQFLNLMFSDMAQEFFPETGVRGGSSNRTYKQYGGTVNGITDMTNLVSTYGWTSVTSGSTSVQLVPLVASRYLPPPQLRKVALYRAQRLPAKNPLLELSSRRPAAIRARDAIIGTGYSTPINTMSKASPILRKTSVGRNFMLGTIYLPPKVNGKPQVYANNTVQNLRMGITFNRTRHSQIIVMGRGNDGSAESPFGGDLKGYHEINGISAQRAALIWLDPRRQKNSGLLVFLSNDGGIWGNSSAAQGVARRDGWIFTQVDSGEYVAVNIAGGYAASDFIYNSVSYGKNLLAKSPSQPIVIQVAEKEWFPDMAAFQRAVVALPLQRLGGSVTFTSMGVGGKAGMVLKADAKTQVASIAGRTVANDDDMVFAGSPYLSGSIKARKFQLRYATSAPLDSSFTYPINRCEVMKPIICPNTDADPYAGLSVTVTQQTQIDTCASYAEAFAQACGVPGEGKITTRWLVDGILIDSTTR